jgi:hypothetical protein
LRILEAVKTARVGFPPRSKETRLPAFPQSFWWVKYSNDKFGFSVQKRIYQGFGGTREYNSEIWEKFGDKVGWRKEDDCLYYKNITFDIKAAKGHLPVLFWDEDYFWGVVDWYWLLRWRVCLVLLSRRDL